MSFIMKFCLEGVPHTVVVLIQWSYSLVLVFGVDVRMSESEKSELQ